jgi:DNA-binding MarR family transcriptional regulator
MCTSSSLPPLRCSLDKDVPLPGQICPDKFCYCQKCFPRQATIARGQKCPTATFTSPETPIETKWNGHCLDELHHRARLKLLLSANEKSKIAYEILSYLAKNPNAQDTLDGIVEWWLLAQHIERHVAKVKGALTELISRGLIEERRSEDSRVYYRLNRRKEKEIAKILEQLSGKREGEKEGNNNGRI